MLVKSVTHQRCLENLDTVKNIRCHWRLFWRWHRRQHRYAANDLFPHFKPNGSDEPITSTRCATVSNASRGRWKICVLLLYLPFGRVLIFSMLLHSFGLQLETNEGTVSTVFFFFVPSLAPFVQDRVVYRIDSFMNRFWCVNETDNESWLESGRPIAYKLLLTIRPFSNTCVIDGSVGSAERRRFCTGHRRWVSACEHAREATQQLHKWKSHGIENNATPAHCCCPATCEMRATRHQTAVLPIHQCTA